MKTDQLDGETDWKLKRSLAPTQSFFTQHKTHLNASSAHQEFDEQNECSCATTSPTSTEAKEKNESEGNTKTIPETNTMKNNKEEDTVSVEDYCRFAQKSFKIHAEPPRSEIYDFCGTYEDETVCFPPTSHIFVPSLFFLKPFFNCCCCLSNIFNATESIISLFFHTNQI